MGLFDGLKSAVKDAVSDAIPDDVKSSFSDLSKSLGALKASIPAAPKRVKVSKKTIGPIEFIQIGDYYIAEHPITIGEWRQFAEETKYLTDAEIGDDNPDRTIQLQNGAWVMELKDEKMEFAFDHMNSGDVDLSKGWGVCIKDMKTVRTPGASWKNPCFPGAVQLTDKHPAVLLSQRDADLFCQWFSYKFSLRKDGIENVSILDADVLEELGIVGTLGHATIENTNFNDRKSGKWFGGTTEYNKFPADEKGFYDIAGNVSEWAYWDREDEKQLGGYGLSWGQDVTTAQGGLRIPFNGNCTVRTNLIGMRIMGTSNEDTLEKRANWERWENNRKKR